MHRLKYIISYVIAVASLAACSGEADVPLPDDARGSIVRLSLTMPVSSRAESHPDLGAINRENEVSDLTVFFYTSANGLNGEASTLLEYSRYFTYTDFIQTNKALTLQFNVGSYAINNNTRMAVVANMGDLTDFTTLGRLQNHIPQSTFTRAGSFDQYNRFTMANANNGERITIINTGETDADGNPIKNYDVKVEIERTVARIDYDPAGATWDAAHNDYRYTAVDRNKRAVADVYVSHVCPFNVMQQPSYALKRISGPASSGTSCFDSWTYTGTLPKTDGRPTSYVIEPHTLAKSSATSDAAATEAWFGDSRAALISEQSHGYFTQSRSLAAVTGDGGRRADNCFVLDYADENTHHVDHTNSSCMTGLVLRAHYVPYQLHNNANLTNPRAAVYGDDIWRYTPQSISTGEADVLYFETEEAAKAYSAMNPDDQAEIHLFPQGICYYYTWIRHTVADNDPDRPAGTFPMEFGIVRNHVYQVAFSFKGIGREGVVIEERDNLECTIMVRPWSLFRHSEIIM